MKKISSYKKLKLKFQKRETELISDIHQLVEHPEEYSGMEIKAKWQMIFDQDRILWFGNG
jgi:hypothetical protein